MNVGVAEVDITPDFSVDLAGVRVARARVGRRARADPRPCALSRRSDSGERLLWIGCDVVALRGELVSSFRGLGRRKPSSSSRGRSCSTPRIPIAPPPPSISTARDVQREVREVPATETGGTSPAARRWSRPALRVVSASAPLDLAVHRRGPASAHSDPVISPWVSSAKTARSSPRS
jgi:hypothetical protein